MAEQDIRVKLKSRGIQEQVWQNTKRDQKKSKNGHREMKRVWCWGSCWRIIQLNCCDVRNLSPTVCLMKALQAHIHSWCLTRRQMMTPPSTSGLPRDMRAFHYQQEVTSLVIVLPTHCDIISVCLEVFMSHTCKCKIEWPHFSVVTIIWYMRFWSPMILSVGSSFCCLHAHVFK